MRIARGSRLRRVVGEAFGGLAPSPGGRPTIELVLLLLLLTANGSPLLARLLLGQRLAQPLDGGRALADGRRLFGDSKTLLGLLTALPATTVLAWLLGQAWWLGLAIAALAMLGDLASSFLKRRLGLASGSLALGLDQVPESLLPLLLCRALLDLGWDQVVVLTLAFMALDLLISRLIYRLGLHQHPY